MLLDSLRSAPLNDLGAMIMRGTLLRSLSSGCGPSSGGAPPRDPRRAHRRADRRRRHDALGHDAAPAVLASDPARVRVRLGGGRAAPRPAGIPPRRPADRRRRGARGADAHVRRRAVRHPPHLRPRGRGGDRLPRRRLPLAHPRGLVRRAALPVLGRHAGLRAGLPLAAADAPAAPVAEAAAGRAAPPVRPQDAGAPRLPRHAAGRVPRRPHRAHPPRPGRRHPVGRVAQHHAVADPLRRRRSPRGRTPVDRADGMVVRPRHGRARPDPGRTGDRRRVRRRRGRPDRRRRRTSSPPSASSSPTSPSPPWRRGSRRTASARRSRSTATRPADFGLTDDQIRERFAELHADAFSSVPDSADARTPGGDGRAARAREGGAPALGAPGGGRGA